MVLVADAGNTNIKLAVYDHDSPVTTVRLLSEFLKTPDAYSREVSIFLRENQLSEDNIDAVAVSTVVPETTSPFLEGLSTLFSVEPLVIDADTYCAITIKTERPRELGADRLVNAAAAFHEYGGPLLVIDMGTATTYDVITENGEFLGGVIAPGLEICAQALWERAAKLPKITIEKPDTIMGTNTIDSMKSGAYYGYLGQLEYFVRQLKDERKTDFKVIATGGLSGIFMGNTHAIDIFDSTLTLKGLNFISRLNRK